MKPNNLHSWQTRAQAQTELVLSRALPPETQSPEGLHEAMRYVTLGGGKRQRPLLGPEARGVGAAGRARGAPAHEKGD